MLPPVRADKTQCGTKRIGSHGRWLEFVMGSFKVKLVGWFALLALLPLAFAFYGYDTLARRSETRRVDAALESGLRAAAAGYGARLNATALRARHLAASPALQTAMRKEDLLALRRMLGVAPPGPTVKRTVKVVDSGRVLGVVTVWLPIDESLLAQLHSGLAPRDRLVAVRNGRVVAGAGRGAKFTLVAGRAGRARLGGTTYRALATATLGGTGYQFAAAAPQSQITSATHATERRIALALTASLALFFAATYLVGRSIVRTLRRLASAADAIAGGNLHERVDVHGNDEFAQVGRAFNEMAEQLEQRLAELEAERSRVQRAATHFGEALAATHDTAQLVRVVAESAIEATGAAGCAVIGPNGELARAGDPDEHDAQIELPLRAGGSDFGRLVLYDDTELTARQIETVTLLAAQVVIALENARLHRIVERQALLDSLTGLANRRSIEEALRSELARAARFGTPAALVLADIDDFKRVNDRYGHAVGDEVLREFADALRETLRESDTAGRWGGEEFALILAGTDADGGAALAERARVLIGERTVHLPGGEAVQVTASFGVAAFPECGGTVALLEAADDALYEAKRRGKNQVVRARESTRNEIV
jgi:diguanylate cyclase (GGDEF)-like protein